MVFLGTAMLSEGCVNQSVGRDVGRGVRMRACGRLLGYGRYSPCLPRAYGPHPGGALNKSPMEDDRREPKLGILLCL